MLVCIVQSLMKRYRVPFFDRLHLRLLANGVTLRVLYSDPPDDEQGKRDHAELDAGYGHKVRARWIARRALWQHAWGELSQADLVIVEHANKCLLNYPLLALSLLELKCVAFWGHGRDRQRDPRAPLERWKRLTLPLADWWFAYTDGTARYLAQSGVSPARITTVQNCVDTSSLRAELDDIAADERDAFRRALGVAPGAKVALFCGALYRAKRVDRLLLAADRARAALPGFTLLVVGDGPEARRVALAAAERPWLRWLGPRFGRDKALAFRAADLLANPGVVGAVALDALTAGLPLVTSDVRGHGPELEYLTDGVDSVVTRDDDAAYAAGLIALAADDARRARLAAAARAAAGRYSLDAMVDRFSGGVLAALGRCAS
jgi:glycosyltransferase involved in cell wall biosynthesis